MIRKLVVVLLAGVMCLLGITGVAIAQKNVTITLEHFWPAAMAVGLDAVARKYEELNPNVKIDASNVPGMLTKMYVEIAAGAAADVYLVEHSFLGIAYAEGVAVPLDPYIEQDPDKWDLDRFFPGILDSLGRYKGELLGMPHILERETMRINMDILKEAGISAPDYDWTWDDLVSIARKVHNPEEDIYGFGSDIRYFLADVGALWGIPWVKEGKPNWTGEKMKELAKFFDEDLLPLLPPVYKESPFGAGELAIGLTGVGRAMGLTGIDFDWEVRPIPRRLRDDPRLAPNITNSMIVASTSPNKEVAVVSLFYEHSRVQAHLFG